MTPQREGFSRASAARLKGSRYMESAARLKASRYVGMKKALAEHQRRMEQARVSRGCPRLRIDRNAGPQ